MVTTTDDVEIDRMTKELEERVKRFLQEEPLYVSDTTTVVERIVASITYSRNEVMLAEETVSRLVRDDEIVIGDPEPDDLNADPRSRSGPYTHRVIWVE